MVRYHLKIFHDVFQRQPEHEVIQLRGSGLSGRGDQVLRALLCLI